MTKSNNKIRNIVIVAVVILALGGLAGFLAWWFTRPANIPVAQAQSNPTSPPSVVQLGTTDTFGITRIDSSYALDNPSNVTHYLSMQEVNDNVSLYLVADSTEVDFQDAFVVKNVQDLEFPHALPATFDPSLYEGGVFVTDDSTVVVDTFEWTIDMTKTANDGTGDASNGTDTTDGTSDSDTNSDTELPILVSELEGSSYSVGGTITIQYRMDVDSSSGNVVQVPFMVFENIQAPSAPGPFLWMTRRANERHGSILPEDIYIPIEGASDGTSFTLEGDFAQDFPEPNVDLSEFANGSFIVWCEPFSVWLGGGPIVVQE